MKHRKRFLAVLFILSMVITISTAYASVRWSYLTMISSEIQFDESEFKYSLSVKKK